jgi:hypothetical protein
LERLPEREAKKKPEEKEKARCFTTDPEATVRKMADGGFRPAYNVQFATDPASQVIVGVAVVMTGSDAGPMAPMVEQLEARYEQVPPAVLSTAGSPNTTRSTRSASRNGVARCLLRCPSPRTRR